MVKHRKTKNYRRNRHVKQSLTGGTSSMRRRSSRKMRGGFQLNGSNIGNTSMNPASNLSLAQGTNYGSIHKDQHGGQNMGSTNSMNMGSSTNSMNMGSPNSMNMGSSTNSMNMPPASVKNYSNMQMGGVAPVGDQGLLDDTLRTSAHLGPLDRSLAEIAGMSDQAGGRRRRRRGRKSRKSRKSRGRKSRGRKSRRNYSMRGGVAEVTDPTTLLTGDALKGAVDGMNPEWKLVEDASAFNPRM